MLVLNTKQEKEWTEIQKILEQNGVLFCDTKNKNTAVATLYAELYVIEQEITTRANAEFIEEQLGLFGLLSAHFGLKEPFLEIILMKDYPESYENTHSLNYEFAEEFKNFFADKGREDVLEELEEMLMEQIHEYNRDHLEIGEEETIQVNIPRKVGEYSF